MFHKKNILILTTSCISFCMPQFLAAKDEKSLLEEFCKETRKEVEALSKQLEKIEQIMASEKMNMESFTAKEERNSQPSKEAQLQLNVKMTAESEDVYIEETIPQSVSQIVETKQAPLSNNDKIATVTPKSDPVQTIETDQLYTEAQKEIDALSDELKKLQQMMASEKKNVASPLSSKSEEACSEMQQQTEKSLKTSTGKKVVETVNDHQSQISQKKTVSQEQTNEKKSTSSELNSRVTQNETKSKDSGTMEQSSGNAESKKPELVAGYNAPLTQTANYPDVFMTASFLYWKAFEDGLEPYTLFTETNTSGGTGTTIRNDNWKVGSMNFEYKPAFKVGLGIQFDHDNWDLYAEYTWYHATFHKSFNLSGPGTFATPEITVTQVLNPTYDLKDNDILFLLAPSTLNSKLHMALNWIDLELGRSCFVGKKLTFRPHFGLRATIFNQKITQSFNLAQHRSGGDLTATPIDNGHLISSVTEKNNSWGLGARAGLNSKWAFYQNFRVFGDISASLLYTRYHLTAKENATQQFLPPGSTDFQIQTASVSFPHPKPLRANLEMDLGLGWGTHFSNDRFYLDLALGYDFLIFWNQSMFLVQRATGNSPSGRSNSSIETLDKNLYLHGLNFTARFDF